MRKDLQAVINRMLPILHQAGVTRAAVFGSSARGDAHGDSDFDLLVELTPDKSLLDLADLKLRLEEVLGRSVDVLTFDSVHPRLRPYIERDQVAVEL